jgi:hypothetical protein
MASQLSEISRKLVLLGTPDIGEMFARMSLDLAPRCMLAHCGSTLSRALVASRRLEEALEVAIQVGHMAAAMILWLMGSF